MTGKQYKELLDAVYASNMAMYFVGMLLSVQLSGWDSWESIWLTAAFGFGMVATFVRNLRAA